MNIAENSYRQKVRNFIYAGYPLAMGYIVFYFFYNAWLGLFAASIFFFTVIGSHLAFKLQKVSLAGMIYVGGGWCAAASATISSGGINSPMLVWVVVIPLIAPLLVYWRQSLYCGVASLIFIAALQAFTIDTALNEFIEPNSFKLMQFAVLLSATLFSTFFGVISAKEHEESLSDLEDERHWNSVILNSVGECILVINPKGKLLMANSKTLNLFGYESDELIGENIKLLVSPTHKEKHDEYLANFMETRKSEIFNPEGREVVGQSKDGAIIPLWLKVQQFYKEDQLLFVGLVRDLRKQKEVERSLEEQRAISFQSAKFSSLGQLAGSIAHEINTPLGALLLSTNALELEAAENKHDLQKIKKHIELSLKIIERVRKIVTSLKTLGRGNPDEALVPTSLNQIVDDLKNISENLLRQQGIEFSYLVTPKDFSASILGNPSQLGQVLMNLINNSADALEDLDEKWIRIEVKSVGEYVKLQYTDSGRGIPSNIAKNIFDPFFTTKDIGRGRGIGLSISKKIIETHGGSLELDENSSHTSFIVSLPKLSDVKVS